MSRSKKVAFFPGKFQPPHIGHVQTLLNILPYYKKLIIGLTEDRASNINISTEDIKHILVPFFKSFDNVEICEIKGVLTEKKDLNGLPEFDIILSGNSKVLEWATNHKLNSKYIPRSEGVFCSGTEIRLALEGTKND